MRKVTWRKDTSSSTGRAMRAAAALSLDERLLSPATKPVPARCCTCTGCVGEGYTALQGSEGQVMCCVITMSTLLILDWG